MGGGGEEGGAGEKGKETARTNHDVEDLGTSFYLTGKNNASLIKKKKHNNVLTISWGRGRVVEGEGGERNSETKS